MNSYDEEDGFLDMTGSAFNGKSILHKSAWDLVSDKKNPTTITQMTVWIKLFPWCVIQVHLHLLDNIKVHSTVKELCFFLK